MARSVCCLVFLIFLRNGYCGEQSLAITAAYYGTWVSQHTLREISALFKWKKTGLLYGQGDSKAQWIVTDNKADPVLDALHLGYTPFASGNIPSPHFNDFMKWVKSWIQQYEVPVIFTMFVKGYSNPDYDHVVVGHGFLSQTFNDTSTPGSVLNQNDVILYAPLQETTGSGGTEAGHYLYDLATNREESNRGKYVFTVPKDNDFGIAMWGYKNMLGTYHTRVEVPRPFPFESPNLAGCARTGTCFRPGTYTANIDISGLQNGKSYTILRYDTLPSVPGNEGDDYCSSKYAARWDFIARAGAHRISDTFSQVGTITYRTIDACPDHDVAKHTGQYTGPFPNRDSVPGSVTAGGGRGGGRMSNDELFNFYYGPAFPLNAYPNPELPPPPSFAGSTQTTGDVYNSEFYGGNNAGAGTYGNQNGAGANGGRRGARRARGPRY